MYHLYFLMLYVRIYINIVMETRLNKPCSHIVPSSHTKVFAAGQKIHDKTYQIRRIV